MPDKYTATWLSHSSISDFLECPRAYFLKHIYKDPKTKNKIKIMSPALALGQAVHETLECLSVLPKDERFAEPLPERFARAWQKVSGKRGGFFDERQEDQFRRRGADMIARVYRNPGPIGSLAVKLQKDLPSVWLSEEDNIMLCGKIDWLEYLPESESVHIIDFKTGRNKEEDDSLQLPIYYLLASRCQPRPVVRASYWYLDSEDSLTEQKLPEAAESERRLLDIGRKIKLARAVKKFDCVEGSCRNCGLFERILAGEGELVGRDEYGADVYVLAIKSQTAEEVSVIL